MRGAAGRGRWRWDRRQEDRVTWRGKSVATGSQAPAAPGPGCRSFLGGRRRVPDPQPRGGGGDLGRGEDPREAET